jgi:CelD/BcsL family acetyltransferase involved in cellulose biosynthesis
MISEISPGHGTTETQMSRGHATTFDATSDLTIPVTAKLGPAGFAPSSPVRASLTSNLSAAPPLPHLRSDLHHPNTGSGQSEPSTDSVAACATTLTFELITDQAAFCALEADWNALFERAGRSTQVFQTFSWNWHWCRHFVWTQHPAPSAGQTAKPATAQAIKIITARHNGRLVMVWPLAMERLGAVRQLVWMGEPVSQYGDILADTSEIGQADIGNAWIYAMTALRPDVVRLRRVRADAIIAPHLAHIASLETVVSEAPHLDLTSAVDFSAYEQRYSAKARKNRRRLARRLEEQGVVKYAQLSQTPEAGYAAQQAVELKQSWLRERGLLSPALADPRFATFMADVASAVERTAGVKVSVLTLNDAPVGIQIGVIAKNRLSLHVIVYDLAHEKSGVGVLHLEHTIAEAYDQGLVAIDLLAPKAEYKMDWADGTVAVIDHAVPVSAIGKLYARVYLGFVRERAKSLIQRLPARLSRHLLPRHPASQN